MANQLFRLTPLGRADRDLKKYLKGKNADEGQLREYEKVLNKYRANRAVHNVVKILLYAGIITSVATTLGFEQARFIAQVASYIGVSILLILYSVTRYFAELYREDFHVKREILIAEVE